MKKEEIIAKDELVAIKIYEHFFNSFDSGLHSHEFVEVAYVLDGECTHIVENERYRVKKGDMYLIDLGTRHGFEVNEGESIKLCNCTFMPEMLSKIVIGENFVELAYSLFFNRSFNEVSGYLCLADSDTEELKTTILMALKEFNERKIGYNVAIKSLVSVMLIRFFRQLGIKNPKNLDSAKQKLVDEIMQKINTDGVASINLEKLSKEKFISPSYMSLLFKKYTGIKLVDFLKIKKMELSVELLVNTNLSITDIIEKVGYSDKHYFYKVFLETYGLTPGEYRKKNKDN